MKQKLTYSAVTVITVLLVLWGGTAFAFTINYTCANLNDGGIAASCVADTWTFEAGSNGLYNLGSGITLPSGDYLVSFTITDGSGTGSWGWIGNVSDVHTQPLTTTEVNYPISIDASLDTANSIFFAEEESFAGVLSGVSITSVEPDPIPIGGATSTLEQAQTNLANSVWFFFVSMFGMIWIMRKH